VKIRIEYSYDPKYKPIAYIATVGNLYFSSTSFKEARDKAIKYFEATKLITIPPPEYVDIGGNE